MPMRTFAIIPICASLFITMLATQPITPPMIRVTIKSISILLGRRVGAPGTRLGSKGDARAGGRPRSA